METTAVEVGQTPLLTVHKKVLVPVLMPETLGEATFKFESEELPAITDQRPVPKVWVMALSVAVDAQML